MLVEAVFESTFGFSYVLFVTVVTLYHVNNVFGVAVNVMVNKSSFAGRIKCIVSKSVVYVVACKAVFSATERTAGFQILTFLSTVTYLLAASLRLVRYHYLLVISYFLYFKFVTFNF